MSTFVKSLHGMGCESLSEQARETNKILSRVCKRRS